MPYVSTPIISGCHVLQIQQKVGYETYMGTKTTYFKQRRVPTLLEYPRHPPKFSTAEIDFPDIQVHPILVSGLDPGENIADVDPSEIEGPWEFKLPQLDGRSTEALGDPNAFP
jgi:hypothetical protein